MTRGDRGAAPGPRGGGGSVSHAAPCFRGTRCTSAGQHSECRASMEKSIRPAPPGPAVPRGRDERSTGTRWSDRRIRLTSQLEEPGHVLACDGRALYLELVRDVDRAMAEPLVRAAAGGRLQRGALSLSLPLVAQDGEGELVGALLTLPPGTVVQTVRQAGCERHALLAMLKYIKIKALAAAERRGAGSAPGRECR